MSRRAVLLIAGNPHDVRLTPRAFVQADLLHDLQVVRSGDEALAYLLKEGSA